MQTTKAKSGCGCGGGCDCGGRCGGGCGCKPARLPEAAPALCSPCKTASFVRPRFFAGQLLTEDDLSALIDYVVSKNRFHNSRLFGEGVVCGLLVECGPCDGQIVVEPGYALDCCGNDLVLTCQQILDIAPMIRELASHKDCGCTDPCTEPAITQTANKEGEQQPPPKPCKQYCLYAKYAERPDQPVAAYPVGGDCDAASCEPTRIVEGIVFELRCPTTLHHPNIHDAEKCCRDSIDTKAMLGNAGTFKELALYIEQALKEAAKTATDAERALVHEALEPEKLFRAMRGAERIIAITRYLAAVSPLLARLNPSDLGLSEGEANKLNGHLDAAAKDLGEADLELVSPLQAALATAARQLRDVGRDVKSQSASSSSTYAMITPEVMGVAHDQLASAAIQLQAAAGCGTPKVRTDCSLQDMIDSLGPSFRPVTERPEITRAHAVLGRASDAIQRFIADCVCTATNPPCPPCDDPGVLLACIDVDHCKVVRICNTVREYALAPSALRYWDAIKVPHAGFCCGQDKPEFRRAEAREVSAEENLGFVMQKIAAIGRPNRSLQAQLAAPMTAREAAAVHEAEMIELRAKVAAFEKRLKDLEKPTKDKQP